MNTCEFCKKEFSRKSNLIHHQKTVKKCLVIQEQQKEKNKNETTLELAYANCKIKMLEEQIKERKEQIKQKDEIIQNLIRNPPTHVVEFTNSSI